MFGILVGHPAPHERHVSSNADVRAMRRLTGMFNIIAWLPFIVLALKKAV